MPKDPCPPKVPEAPANATDPRVRLVQGNYRVVAPNAKRANDRTFVNGELVIQRQAMNAMKEINWVDLHTFAEPSKTKSGSEVQEAERQLLMALRVLLGMGAE